MNTTNETQGEEKTENILLDLNGIISRDALGWWVINVDETIKEYREHGDPENLFEDGEIERMEQILVLCNGLFKNEFEISKRLDN